MTLQRYDEVADLANIWDIQPKFVISGVTSGRFWDEWSILDVYAAEEIAGDDVEGGGFRVGGMCGMIADAADEAAALYYDIDVGGHEELDAAAEGVDVNLLVLVDDGFAQVHADAATESVKAGTVECLAAIDVLVAAIMYLGSGRCNHWSGSRR